MKFTLDALITIEAIVRNGSFSAAAEELHKVRSALTYKVQKLEQDLGVTIFDRSGHRAQLTPAGEVLLDEGRQLLHDGEQLESRVKAISTGWESTLTLAYNEAIPFADIARIVAAFNQHCPQTTLVLKAERLNGTIEVLVENRAQLCIGVSGFVPEFSGVDHIKMPSMDFVFAISPKHPLAKRVEPLLPSDIQAFTSVAASDSSLRMMGRTSGIEQKQKVLTVNSMHAKVAAQVNGLGVGYLPQALIASELANNELIIKKVKKKKPILTLFAAWSTQHKGQALNWLIDYLKAFKYSY